MRAAHRAMLLAAAVGAELRNHGCPDLRFLNHTGRSLACVRLHSTQQRLHRAKRCLLDGVAGAPPGRLCDPPAPLGRGGGGSADHPAELQSRGAPQIPLKYHTDTITSITND